MLLASCFMGLCAVQSPFWTQGFVDCDLIHQSRLCHGDPPVKEPRERFCCTSPSAPCNSVFCNNVQHTLGNLRCSVSEYFPRRSYLPRTQDPGYQPLQGASLAPLNILLNGPQLFRMTPSWLHWYHQTLYQYWSLKRQAWKGTRGTHQ